MEKEVKEAAPKYNFISREEYLVLDQQSEERIEFYEGLILAMSGASYKHNVIERNLVGLLHTFLKGKECSVLPSDMRVTNASRDYYLYPDACIFCGEPVFEEGVFDTLTNPSVIFEILSPSTKETDKRRKFFFYIQIPSLEEYIMIDSQKHHIICARKQPDNSWKFEELYHDAMELQIHSIGFLMPITDLYDGTEI